MLQRLRYLPIFATALRHGTDGRLRSRRTYKVRWADCDINRHMNNARYLAMMDLGRWELILRSGMLRGAMQRRMPAVVVEIDIRYRRELKPGQRYELETEFYGLEGRKLWVRQRFLIGDRVHAEAMVGHLFLHDGKVAGTAAVARLMDELDLAVPSAAPGPRRPAEAPAAATAEAAAAAVGG